MATGIRMRNCMIVGRSVIKVAHVEVIEVAVLWVPVGAYAVPVVPDLPAPDVVADPGGTGLIPEFLKDVGADPREDRHSPALWVPEINSASVSRETTAMSYVSIPGTTTAARRLQDYSLDVRFQ
jgi:hypothetical protein